MIMGEKQKAEYEKAYFDAFGKRKPFWLSIRKAKNCLFSRRTGRKGKLVLGYSICLRLFGKDLI